MTPDLRPSAPPSPLRINFSDSALSHCKPEPWRTLTLILTSEAAGSDVQLENPACP